MSEFDPDALIEAMVPLLDLQIESHWRDHIKIHLAIAATHAGKLLAVPLPDAEEPAPVFLP